jgi:adenylate cyclase
MRPSRREIKEAFARLVPEEIAEVAVSEPDKIKPFGEMKYMTVMFTDVQAFQTICESLSMEGISKLLSLYLTEMSRILTKHKGTVLNYSGDSIVAVFGAPTPTNQHSIDACLSAVRMKESEAKLHQTLQQEGITGAVIRSRIGINTDNMLAGLLGTQYRMQYDVMGNGVNLAARLVGMNRHYGTFMLMTDGTYQHVNSLFVVRKLDRIRVVGIPKALRLYELIGEDGKIGQAQEKGLISTFHQGLEHFENRQWKAAKESFSECLRSDPADGPSKVFLQRCQDFEEKEPHSDWDGVFDIK